MLQRILLDECSPSFIKSRTVSALGLPRRIPSLRWPLSGLLASSSSSPPEAAAEAAGGGATRPRSPGCSAAAAAAGKAAEAAPAAAPGLSVTLCAFSPQRHGYTMKSLKPGLVGMSGGGGSGSPPPPHVGLIGVVLMTDTSTRFGESWQKMTGGGCGWLSAIGASMPRIIARPRSAAPAAALPEPWSGPSLRSPALLPSRRRSVPPAHGWRTFPGILLRGGQRSSGAARMAPGGQRQTPNPGSGPPSALCTPQRRLHQREAAGGLPFGDRRAGLAAPSPRK